MAFRINFGRLFPGLLIFLIGLGLLVLWLLLAVLSFFLFFIPGAHWFFYVALDVGIFALVLMGIGALLMALGVSGWYWLWREATPSHVGPTRRRADRDWMSIPERLGELFGLVISLLILLFFVENQIQNTGFFTSAFGSYEQVAFYGPWVLGLGVMLLRASFGRRNPVRPLEALQDLFLAVSAFWLLSVFPFQFSHLPDLLPHAVHFIFSWINNEVGALALVLVGIGGLVGAVYTSFRYLTVRSETPSSSFNC